jgi:hypothetical protein
MRVLAEDVAAVLVEQPQGRVGARCEEAVAVP